MHWLISPIAYVLGACVIFFLWHHSPSSLVACDTFSMLYIAIMGCVLALFGTRPCYYAYYQNLYSKPYEGIADHLYLSLLTIILALLSPYFIQGLTSIEVVAATSLFAAYTSLVLLLFVFIGLFLHSACQFCLKLICRSLRQ